MTANEKLETLKKRIPAGFTFGAATASWQIEGDSKSRGSSIWDDFSAIPGKVLDGATADPACDHYNRFEEDLDLLIDLGVDAYRFSFSWPRVLPNGTGEKNQAGLDFYDRMIDGLLARGISPVATLYHWDLPSAQQAKGGWASREIYSAFEEYTALMADYFGDRVDRWATLNEPWVSAFLGHAAGIHAPGIKDAAMSLEVAYRLMVTSGKSIEVLRSKGAKNPGIVLNLTTVIADDAEIEPAAKHIDNLQNRFWLDILAGRGIGQDIIESTASVTDWSFVDEADLKTAATEIDWLGVNYYSPIRIASKPADGPDHIVGQVPDLYPACPPVHFVPRKPQTEMGWEIHAPSLTTTLQRISKDLPGKPIFISENGAAFDDKLVDGKVDDVERVDYYAEHISAAFDAVEAGVPLKGYFAWSLLDNLEWAEGWTKRFGITRVTADDQTRRPKNSYYFLQGLYKSRS